MPIGHPRAIEQVVQRAASSHPQALRDPAHRHRCLRPKAHRQRHFAWIPFGFRLEIGLLPPPSPQFLRNSLFRLHLCGPCPLLPRSAPPPIRSLICASNSSRNVSSPQAPTAPDLLLLPALLPAAPRLQPPIKPFSTCPTVRGNTPLSPVASPQRGENDSA